MDEEQGLSSPLLGGLRDIRRNVSSSIFGGRRAPNQVQGDNISSSLIQKNSLALNNVSLKLGGITEQVNNINSSLTLIKDNLAISDDIARKKELAKRKREAQLAEQGLREGKESELEKKVQFALLTPVRRVANFARGILGRLGESLLILAGGWLTTQVLRFLQLNSEGNIEALNKFKDRFLKDLLVIGGIVLVLTGKLGAVFGLVKGLGLLLSKIVFGGFVKQAFGNLGIFLKNNTLKFIRFIKAGLIGFGRGLNLKGLLPLGFIFQNRITRAIKNFFSGAGDDLMKIPFFKKMMDSFGKTGLGKSLDKFGKSGGFGKLLSKSLSALYIAFDTFNGKAELEQQGLKPLQALITSFSRAVTQFGLFTAFIKATSLSVGGIFAGVGALLGLMGGPLAPLTSGALAAKGFVIGKGVGAALGILGFLFPGITKKLTGGLVDLEKFAMQTDEFATEAGMTISGVDDETKDKVRQNVLGTKDVPDVDDSITGVNVGGGEIVPFKTVNNGDNLALNGNAANIIDTTTKKKRNKRGSAFANKNNENQIPNIDSKNKNDLSDITSVSMYNIP